MRAITLWQPWASLVAAGLKQYETRSWPTSYRGPLAIHAALRPMGANEDLLWLGALIKARRDFTAPPLGVVVATCDLVDCLRTEDVLDRIGVDEQGYGNFSLGRFAWKLTNVIALRYPVPCLGRQGFFNATLAFPPSETQPTSQSYYSGPVGSAEGGDKLKQ